MQKAIISILAKYLNVLNIISKRVGSRHAFFVFCYPIPVKLKPAQLKFIATSRQGFFDFDGKKVATYEWGSGPEVILCLHGWQSQTYRWKKFIETLDKEKYTLLSIDAPAHGNSEGKILYLPLYANLIERLMAEYSPDYILAHSMGAFSSLALFYEKPKLSPKKMALLGTPGEVTEFVEEYARVLKISDRVKKNLSDYFIQLMGHGAEYYSAKKFATKQLAQGLIIHDEGDKDAPFRHGLAVHKNWPNSEMYVTKGLGHKLRSIDVVQKVEEFFAQD